MITNFKGHFEGEGGILEQKIKILLFIVEGTQKIFFCRNRKYGDF